MKEYGDNKEHKVSQRKRTRKSRLELIYNNNNELSIRCVMYIICTHKMRAPFM